MAVKTIPLESIPQNWYMGWTISTQTARTVCVTLQDSTTTYIDKVSKASTSFLPPLSTGFQQVTGTGLTLTLEIENCDFLKCVLEPFTVNHSFDNNPVVQGFNILVQDDKSSNYTALLATIVAWPSVS